MRYAAFCFGSMMAMLLGAWRALPDLEELLKQTQEKLNMAYSIEIDQPQLKKIDLQLTKDGFFRLRKTFINGKQEYFSFNFSQFDELKYLGNTQKGLLVLKTKPESIIVQTYRDAAGNIDTMASELKFPVKEMDAPDIEVIQDCFMQAREKLK